MAIDLTGQFFNSIQQNISKGQGLNLDFTVANNGDEDVQPFSFDIVLSRDNEISKDDFRLGTYEIKEGLKAGENSGTKSYRYSTPAANNPFWLEDNDSYYVGIRIDPENDILESNEANNSNQGSSSDVDSINVIEFGASDLRASFMGLGQQRIQPGGKLDLSFTVANDSEEFANPFSVGIYISNDENIDPENDVKLGTYDIRNMINPGEDTGVKSFSYATPELGNALWGNGDGNYYIGLDIDAKDEVKETNEENNINQGVALDYVGFEMDGLDSVADLAGTSFEAPETFEAGDTIEVEYEITNQGGADANLFAAGFYLFTEDYLANNDHLSIEDVPEVYFLQGDRDSSLINLEPGESTGTMTTELTIPQEWAGFSGEGEYYLGFEADVFDDVVESNDFNNSLTGEMVDYKKVTIDAPVNNTVDLVGTHFEVVQDQIMPGQLFDLGFTIANEGMASIDDFQFDLYLSQDESISADEDVYLGTYNVRDGIAGNSDFGLRSARYRAPEMEDAFWSKGDGTYYAGMIIDPQNDIAETNEDNNSNLGQDLEGKDLDSAKTNVTGLGAIADLKTNGSFDVMPDTIATGETFEVQYDIFNQGDASADLFAAGFYIFKEDYLTNHDALSVEDVPEVYFLQGDRASSLISLEPATGTGVVTTELTMPTDWAGFAGGSGEYYIGVAADPYNDIAESDEMNNSLQGTIFDYEKVTINVGENVEEL